MKDPIQEIEERYSEIDEDGDPLRDNLRLSFKVTLKDLKNLLKLVKAYENDIRNEWLERNPDSKPDQFLMWRKKEIFGETK